MPLRRRTLLAAAAAGLAAPCIARAAERTKITLWHAMASTPGDELARLIAKFNASQDSIEVTGLFKGVYKDLLTAVAAAWRRSPAGRSRPSRIRSAATAAPRWPRWRTPACAQR